MNLRSGVASTRISLSIDPAIQAAIKAHAEAAGMDVSAYVVAAAIAQMAADDAASAAFAPLDARNAAAVAEAADMESTPLPAFEDLTAEEQHLSAPGTAVGANAATLGHADILTETV
jgi:uncharacterized protein (DUF1778 family)